MTWRWIPLALFLAKYAAAVPAPENEWEWFSDQPRAFRALLADPREAQVRLGALRAAGKSYLDLGFGGHLGVVRRNLDDSALEITVRGLVTARFQHGSRSFDHRNTDFIGGLGASYAFGDHALDFFFSHQSSHLGDDVIAQGLREPINYSFETARALYSRALTHSLRLYIGADVKTRADPSRLAGKLSFIIGGEWRVLPQLPALFTALDLRFKEEHGGSPDLSWVMGYELGGFGILRRQRLFLELFNGHSHLGQFGDQRESYAFFGIGFTL